MKKNIEEDSDNFSYDIDTRPFFETKWEQNENGEPVLELLNPEHFPTPRGLAGALGGWRGWGWGARDGPAPLPPSRRGQSAQL